MAFSYYYVDTNPVNHTKKYYSLTEAQEYHKALWVWKSENPNKKLEEWPQFTTGGGTLPPPFMYAFACDLTKDKLGVRRCQDCPYKWIDKETNKAVGRWSPWHWCDYPGALVNKYFQKLEEDDFEGAKAVALEISNLTLSSAAQASVVRTQDQPTYDELVDRVKDLEAKVN